MNFIIGKNRKQMSLLPVCIDDYIDENNPKALKNVFRDFVKFCDKADLFRKELLAVDDSKFKAWNTKDRNFTKDMMAAEFSVESQVQDKNLMNPLAKKSAELLDAGSLTVIADNGYNSAPDVAQTVRYAVPRAATVLMIDIGSSVCVLLFLGREFLFLPLPVLFGVSCSLHQLLSYFVCLDLPRILR